ncbi:hypothetical protein HPB49_008671 [Dermacentor silvarum]|uniref:Uncharacterized protein n=1 Tax=Dermacentor silvarum TaxID=543639 RepID=A0ACB8CK86_DERSI|nr:hypothetical protein HPB49_008671 [Dermacentor silvarum]
MPREMSLWIAFPLLLAVAAAEEPRDRPLGGAERLARGLQKKVHCAGLSAFECVQCLSPSSMAHLPNGNDTNEAAGDRKRERMSVLLLERLSDMRQPCHAGRCGSYEQCRAALQLASPGRLARLEDILRRVKAVYVPTSRRKCFTAEDVLNSLAPYEKNEETYVEKVATSVITHLSQGHCIEVGDAVTDFLEDLFRRYGDNSSEVMTQQVRPAMNGPKRNFTTTFKTAMMTTNMTMKRVLATGVAQCCQLEANPPCILVQTSRGGDDVVSPQYRTMTSTITTALLPKLMALLADRCALHNAIKRALGAVYGYGTLSVFIISLCSLMGVLLLPCLARHAYYYIMMGFIGLSFGTMTGDAFLHLIPQVLGLHSHDADQGAGGHSHAHSHDHDSLVPEYMWKQLGLIGALYGLFIFEALSTIFGGEQSDGHGHSHLPKNIPEDLHMTKVSQKTESSVELAHCSSTPSLALEENPQVPVLKSRALCCGMSTLATMVIIGGAIHNVADGLAIGAAFSSGLKSGLSTSLAVFCHELPHEFGDFVVLISTGLGYRRALLLNFLSAMAAFAGLYAGFLLGEEAAARDWILTVTAGIFLYVALVDMLPELKQHKGKSPFKMFIVKNIGVLAGVGIMCVIAIYEDQLNI